MTRTRLKAHVGFLGGKPAHLTDRDTYGVFRGVTLFDTRTDARTRFKDVRPCTVTIQVETNKARKRT